MFEKILADFDKQSEQYIKQCQKEIADLPLPAHITTLKAQLKKWPEKLYWRK